MYIYIVHINIFSFTPLTVPTSPDTRNMCKYIQLIPFEILKLPQRSIQTTESFDTCSLTCWYRIQNWKISISCIFQKGIFRCLCFWYILCVVFVIIISCCCLKINKTVYLRRQNMCKCQSIGRTVLRQFVMKRIYMNIGVFVLIELKKKIIFIVQNIQVSDFFIFLKFSNNVVYAFLYILEWVKRLYTLKIKVCYVLSIFKKYYCFKVTN